ncbi:carboxypeptidase-like regulatory domain-containing protein [Acidobacteriia bacterium AH_259_A11_L15]|nr:carboxypeptidase-like regulatory domain-containing protein [Acidobacteriia bacterium AH_259_A11_L15]
MKLLRLSLVSLAAALALALFPADAPALEIEGRVVNATTGRPVPGQFVNLLALRNQMVPVRETQTDSQGRYRFVIAANPNERFLVQVPFRGVNYNQLVMFSTGGRLTTDVSVYEADAAPADISVQGQIIFLEPHGDHVRISESYSLRNHSQPPRTYNPDQGSFRFALPDPVGDLQVSAGRPGGMPLRQQPQATETEGEYVIPFPLHPGETEIQLSYAVPVSGTAFELTLPLAVPAERRLLAVPRLGVRLESAALTEIEQSERPEVRIYAVDAQAPGLLTLRLEVDPEALAASPTPSTPEASEAQSLVSIVPHPVYEKQWYIVGLSLLVLLFGLYYLSSLDPGAGSTNDSARQSH